MPAKLHELIKWHAKDSTQPAALGLLTPQKEGISGEIPSWRNIFEYAPCQIVTPMST